MNVDDYPGGPAKDKIAEVFKNFPSSEIRFGEYDVFGSAHAREAHLGSSYKEDTEEGKGTYDVVCLYYEDQVMGSLSFFLEKNEIRAEKGKADHFARIDIVIVEKEFRNIGVGKLLVFTTIKYLLDRWGQGIYSISCLAAHAAMAKILEQVGFESEQRASEDFRRETISFGDDGIEAFSAFIDERVSGSMQLTRYRLRQPAVKR